MRLHQGALRAAAATYQYSSSVESSRLFLLNKYLSILKQQYGARSYHNNICLPNLQLYLARRYLRPYKEHTNIRVPSPHGVLRSNLAQGFLSRGYYHMILLILIILSWKRPLYIPAIQLRSTILKILCMSKSSDISSACLTRLSQPWRASIVELAGLWREGLDSCRATTDCSFPLPSRAPELLASSCKLHTLV